MVKMEHANSSVSVSDPVTPPGFPPNPPKTSANDTAAAAVVPAIEQTSKEDQFPHGNEQRKSPDLTAEQSNRRVRRKRTRPEFYKPPNIRWPAATPRRPAASQQRPGEAPRRRGRPPKARLVSILTNQEPQTKNRGEVTTTKERPHSPGNNQAGRATSMSRNTRAGFIDQCTLIDENLAHIVEAITEKHGDITSECPLKSDHMKTHVLISVCHVVRDLQNKQLKDVDDVSWLDAYYSVVEDLENMKVNVRWLQARLDEIKEAVNLSNDAKTMADEKNRLVVVIDRKKEEVERLKSQLKDVEEQLAKKVVRVVELNKMVDECMSKISRFDHASLLDGLL